MMNLLLACPVISDNAVLSGSYVAASLPLSNLKTMPVGQPTRFMTPANAFLISDLNNSHEIDLVALLGHNATAGGTVRVRAADTLDDLLTTPIYDSDTLRMRSNITGPDYNDIGSLERNHFILYLDEPVKARYWRFDITDPVGNYIDIGRLYVAKAFQPAVNMDYGLSEGIVDPSDIRVTKSGRDIPNEKPKYRMTELTLSFGSKEEMFGDLYNFDAWRGTTRDILYVQNYDDKALLQKRSLYARITELSPINNSYHELFEKTYRLKEIIA